MLTKKWNRLFFPKDGDILGGGGGGGGGDLFPDKRWQRDAIFMADAMFNNMNFSALYSLRLNRQIMDLVVAFNTDNCNKRFRHVISWLIGIASMVDGLFFSQFSSQQTWSNQVRLIRLHWNQPLHETDYLHQIYRRETNVHIMNMDKIRICCGDCKSFNCMNKIVSLILWW